MVDLWFVCGRHAKVVHRQQQHGNGQSYQLQFQIIKRMCMRRRAYAQIDKSILVICQSIDGLHCQLSLDHYYRKPRARLRTQMQCVIVIGNFSIYLKKKTHTHIFICLFEMSLRTFKLFPNMGHSIISIARTHTDVYLRWLAWICNCSMRWGCCSVVAAKRVTISASVWCAVRARWSTEKC